jgi:hypothetical protein
VICPVDAYLRLSTVGKAGRDSTYQGGSLTAYARGPVHGQIYWLKCRRVASFLLFVLIGLPGCASSPGELMIARRHAFEADFIPTVGR